jgi:hypothetical protein
MTDASPDPIDHATHPAVALPAEASDPGRVAPPPLPVPTVSGRGAPASLRVVVGVAAALVVASVVLRVVMRVIDLPASAGAHVVPVGVAVAGGVLAVRWARRGVRRQLADGVAAKVAEFGGGLYGSVAFATLLYLEAMDLVGDVAAAGSLGGFVGGLSFAWLMEQMMESIGFFVTAIMWPWYWLSALGPAAAAIVAGAVWAIHGVTGGAWAWWTDRRGPWRPRVAAAEEIP